MNSPQRLPHAAIDLDRRRLKALKIERLLGLDARAGESLRLLEVGCGAGGISHHFANHHELKCEVDAVDVIDGRAVKDGYRFALVEGVTLPFPDASFDVVISNHVIEHVGDRTAQALHLSEIRRVMKRGARCYLAVPNRWQLIEPHYRLPFLSWLPRGLRTPYLNLIKKGRHYDCEPLALAELEGLLSVSGFRFSNVCIQAMRMMSDIEGSGSLVLSLTKVLPSSLLTPFKGIIPTLIYVLD